MNEDKEDRSGTAEKSADLGAEKANRKAEDQHGNGQENLSNVPPNPGQSARDPQKPQSPA